METLAKHVAASARRLLRAEISYEEFLALVPEDPDDEAIAELLDLIAHTPKQGGFLGVSPSVYQGYLARIEQAIATLERALANAEGDDQTLASASHEAASDLGLDIVAPFVVDLGHGERLTVDVLVRDFGARLGMLIFSDYKVIAPFAERLVEAGFGYSAMSAPRTTDRYSRESYLEILEDWGWSGSLERRPDWLR